MLKIGTQVVPYHGSKPIFYFEKILIFSLILGTPNIQDAKYVILTGFFGRKYALFRGGCQISTSGGPHKIDPKKNIFFILFIQGFPNHSQLSAKQSDRYRLL